MIFWIELGLDPELFWRVTPRYAAIIVKGQIGRVRLDEDRQRAAAWLSARLMAYAPEKSEKFQPVEKFMSYGKTKRVAVKARWQDQFAAVSAWVNKGKA